MGSFKNIVVAMVGLWAMGTLGEVCSSLPARTGVGRDTGMAYDAKEDWCPGQIEACGFICGGKTSSNTCSLFSSSYACYDCQCADGTTPPLDIYHDTIPQRICQQYIDNCAASPSGSFSGRCDAMPKCGSLNPDPTPPAPVTIWPSELVSVAPAPSDEPIVVPEPVIAEPTTTTTTIATTSSVAIESPTVIAVVLTTSSSVVLSTTSSTLVSVTSSVALNSTSLISTSTLVSSSTQSSSKTTTSSRTSSRTSTTSAVSTSLLQGAAMITSVPWVHAAIGVAGFVIAGL